jgi:serine/threonine protein kinase
MSAAARVVAKREVFALAALPDCPNLVRYYDAWSEDNGELLFVQMEYLPGGTLRGLAEQHRLSEAGARRAVRDAARALAYMHSKKIGHLDVKPENILAVGDGSFKLGDLGHATLLDKVVRIDPPPPCRRRRRCRPFGWFPGRLM